MEICVNLEGIEHLAQKLHRIVMDADDIILRIRMLRSEMEEDSTFNLLPDSVTILNIMDETLVEITQIYETAIQLRTLVEKTPDLFREQETLFMRRINELSNQLEMLGIKIDTAMKSEQIVLEDNSTTKNETENLERVLLGHQVNLEISDVSPMKKNVEEVFPVHVVIDLEKEYESNI